MEKSRTRRVLDSASPSSPSCSGRIPRRPAMDSLQGISFVRVQSCARRGMYLSAEGDGATVCLRAAPRAAANTIWRVEPAVAANGEDGFLLRGSFGHYLVASDLPAATGSPGDVIAEQEQCAIADDWVPPLRFLWDIAMKEKERYVVIQNLTGRFLRANGRYLRWRKAVTVTSDTGTTMQRWSVEALGNLDGEKIRIESLLKQEKDSLSSIRSERGELIGQQKEIKEKKAAARRKALALTSTAEKMKKREKPPVDSSALRHTLNNLQITNKANLSYENKEASIGKRICELNSLEVDKKKEIEYLSGTLKAFKSRW